MGLRRKGVGVNIGCLALLSPELPDSPLSSSLRKFVLILSCHRRVLCRSSIDKFAHKRPVYLPLLHVVEATDILVHLPLFLSGGHQPLIPSLVFYLFQF